MAKNTIDLSTFYSALPKNFKCAEAKRTMPQHEKVRFVAALALTRLFRDGGVSIEQLEQDAAGRVTGRLNLTLGAGVGGKGGMRIIRTPEGEILCCRDNLLNLLDRLGRDGFERWLTEQKVALADFEAWLQKLPSI